MKTLVLVLALVAAMASDTAAQYSLTSRVGAGIDRAERDYFGLWFDM